ncbi:hypothetical protein CHS0354_034416 [Potamilus streckersoni]|uniref:Uncharacterized protein n=1 Tax=Potamilus streckersoni TaxID=2493646 RepID=A0AAE0S8F4_9BIVA|nr:hypothetical protein CHS0354_034416 [Potamilus streckersoni]
MSESVNKALNSVMFESVDKALNSVMFESVDKALSSVMFESISTQTSVRKKRFDTILTQNFPKISRLS